MTKLCAVQSGVLRHGGNKIVSVLFRTNHYRHDVGAPIRLLHVSDVTQLMATKVHGSAISRRLSEAEPESGPVKECHDLCVCVSKLANWHCKEPGNEDTNMK